MKPNVVCFSVLHLVLVLPLPVQILLLIKPLLIEIWVLLSQLTCPSLITFLKCVHVHIILSTLSEGMSVSAQPSSPSAVLKSLYVSLVWSKLLYCCQLWSTAVLRTSSCGDSSEVCNEIYSASFSLSRLQGTSH